jgi:antitoxin component of MazEF toxin-antitoxin module
MARTFKTKVRKVGTSFGVLIPKDVVEQEKIKEGEEVTVGLLKHRKIEEVLKLFGTAKHAKSFRRDRVDRLERY